MNESQKLCQFAGTQGCHAAGILRGVVPWNRIGINSFLLHFCLLAAFCLADAAYYLHAASGDGPAVKTAGVAAYSGASHEPAGPRLHIMWEGDDLFLGFAMADQDQSCFFEYSIDLFSWEAWLPKLQADAPPPPPPLPLLDVLKETPGIEDLRIRPIRNVPHGKCFYRVNTANPRLPQSTDSNRN